MPSNPINRQIRVFISSTFTDMKADRDYLVKFTFPQLRDLCESRAVTWGEVDFRWGVTDEQKAEGKVLPIVLAEIQNCYPYFIGMLGERYGQVYHDELPVEIEEQFPWLKQNRNKSLTELEILHGVLNNHEVSSHAFFYFRDPAYAREISPAERGNFVSEDSTDQQKLAVLKERIRQRFRDKQLKYPPRENYSNPEALGELVLADFTEVINTLYPTPEVPDPLDQEAARHESYARSRRLAFIGRKDLLRHLDEQVSTVGKPIVLYGESGCGKSALLAEWIVRWREKNRDDIVIQHYVGSTPDSAGWQGLVRRILGELKRALAFSEDIPSDPFALRQALHDWTTKSADDSRRIILVLDALNQLADDSATRPLSWLPSVFSANVRLIVSTLPGESLNAIQKRRWSELNVPLFSRSDVVSATLVYFGVFSKTPSKDLLAKLESTPSACNALYLRAVLDELRQLGEHEELKARAVYYLSALSPKDLYERILARWEEDFGFSLVCNSLSLISASRRGLSESELTELLGEDGQHFPRSIWTPFYLAVQYSLAQRSGLLNFFHEFLRAAVRDKYFNNETEALAHKRLANYFESRPANLRRIDELPWQLAEAGLWRRLAAFLANPDHLRILVSFYKSDAKRYWHSVESFTAHKMPDIYCEAIKNPSQFEVVALAISDLLDETGYPDKAMDLLTNLSQHYINKQNEAGVVASLSRLGLLHRDKGNLERAATAFRDCAAAVERAGLRQAEAATVHNQATVLTRLGQLVTALIEFRRAERIYRRDGEERGLCRCLMDQAAVLDKQGHCKEAEVMLDEAMEIAQSLKLDEETAQISLYRAGIHYCRGELATAQNFLDATEPFFEQLGDRSHLAEAYLFIGLVHKSRGNYQAALSHHQQAAAFYKELGYLNQFAQAIGNQAEALIRLERPEEARGLNQESIDVFRRIGNARGLAVSLVNEGIILHVLGNSKGAETSWREAERLSRNLDAFDSLGHALDGLACLRKENHKADESIECFDKAIEAFTKAGSSEGLCVSLLGRAQVLFEDLDDRGQALSDLERVIDISKQFGFEPFLLQALSYVARHYRQASELPFALLAAREWCSLVEVNGKKSEIAHAHLTVSDVLINLGQLADAEKEADVSVIALRNCDDRKLLAVALMQRSYCLRSMGSASEAITLLDEGILIAKEMEGRAELVRGLGLKSQILRHDLGRHTEADRILNEAAVIAKQHGLLEALRLD